jgi:PAS domain S-box-containing protein
MLRSGHVQAQGVVDTLDLPLLVLDQDLRITAANPAFLDTFGVERDETIGESLLTLGNGQWDIPELRTLLADVVPRASAVIDYAVSDDFPGIGHRTMLVSARRLAHPGGHNKDLLLTFEDVTDRERAEAEKDILLAETRHRMRNQVAMVRAIAGQTRADGRSGEEYRDAFLDRMATMTRAEDDSLTHVSESDLADLVHRAVDPIATGRLRVGPGPSVRLKATQTQPVSLILHELAINALKYGAFSVAGGVVRVSWDAPAQAEGARSLRFDWREEGGPPVAPPTTRGFGTRLIQFSARTDLGGEARMHFAPNGLHAQICIPLE